MKKTINNKTYDLNEEVVEYIDELEYYHNFTPGKRVIEIHYGFTGNIIGIYKDYASIPNDLIPEKEKFFNEIKVVNEGHKEIQWIFVKCEKFEKVYAYPFVFWRIMPALEINDDSDEDFDGEIASDV